MEIIMMLGIALVIVALALLGYARWFLRPEMLGFPYCRVEILPAHRPGRTDVVVTLEGVPRAYQLTSVTHEAPSGMTALPVPDGFEVERDHDFGEQVLSWKPSRPLRFEPEQPVPFTFAYDPALTEPVRLSGWIEATIGLGGSMAVFHIPVGPIPEDQRAYLNLNSRVRAEAVRDGIVASEHPEWTHVLAEQARLGKAPPPV